MNKPTTEKTFGIIAEHLKTELGMVDSAEYDRMKQLEEAERKAKLQEIFRNNFEHIDLTKEAYTIISDIAETLPDEFFEGISTDRGDFFCEYGTVKDLGIQHPDLYKRFLRKLASSNVAMCADDFRFPEIEMLELQDEPIETLLDLTLNGDDDEKDEASQLLWEKFEHQTRESQLGIVRAMLEGSEADRFDCYIRMLKNWWDDEIILDVEKAWKKYKDPYCLRVIAYRFPLEYVLAHQNDIGEVCYFWLCLRLAAVEGFVVDKTRLTRAEYGRVVANNHILLSGAEAEDLLFGHILERLRLGHQAPEYYWKVWSDNCAIETESTAGTCENYLSELLCHKPSITYLPGVTYYIRCLKHTGNIEAIMKLLFWDNQLQSQTKGFLEEECRDGFDIGKLPELYRTYMSRSWEQLMTLAEESCPLKQEDLTDVFLRSDISWGEYLDFEPY